MRPIKLYLDDERQTPDGFKRAYWPNRIIRLLQKCEVTHVSLDHDLSDDDVGTGNTVILWIEEQVALHGFKPPEITIHSANPSARIKMELGIEAIKKLAKANEEKTNKAI